MNAATSPLRDDGTAIPPPHAFVPLGGQQGWCGTDYYGALHVAALYAGLRRPPRLFPGVWQHGCIPPWQQVQPEMVVYTAPREVMCFVARPDEVDYLHRGGYHRTRAIGLPIVYTASTGVSREPETLLVMPTHAVPGDSLAMDSDAYVEAIASMKNRFRKVVACVSARCIAQGLWSDKFDAAGIEVVTGAGVDDRNSLPRIRHLMERYEFLTTDSFGSHVFYGLYLGARVSLWGEAVELGRARLLKDPLWAQFPDAVDRFLSEDTRACAEGVLARFRVPPWEGIADVDLGAKMVGHGQRLSPRQLQKAFGWTFANRVRAQCRGAISTGVKTLRRIRRVMKSRM